MRVIQSFSLFIICLRFRYGHSLASTQNLARTVPDKNAVNMCVHDGRPVDLLVMVDSDAGQVEERNVLRASWRRWWGDMSGNGTVVFFVGRLRDSEVTNSLLYESDANADMYWTVPGESSQHSKVVRMQGWLHWVLDNCRTIKFVLKLGNNAFVNVPALLDFIGQNGKATNTIWGSLVKTPTVYRSPVANEVQNLPYTQYAEGSYLMTGDVVEKLFHGTFQSMLSTNEDEPENSLLTGTIAGYNKIKVKNNVLFKGMRVSSFKQLCNDDVSKKQLIYLMGKNKMYLTPNNETDCQHNKTPKTKRM